VTLAIPKQKPQKSARIVLGRATSKKNPVSSSLSSVEPNTTSKSRSMIATKIAAPTAPPRGHTIFYFLLGWSV